MAATSPSPVARCGGGGGGGGARLNPASADSVEELVRRIREAVGHDDFKLSTDAGKLHVTEAPCHACDGAGTILLLVSRRPCRRCGGTGLFSANVDFPLTGPRVERFCRSIRERQA